MLRAKNRGSINAIFEITSKLFTIQNMGGALGSLRAMMCRQAGRQLPHGATTTTPTLPL